MRKNWEGVEMCLEIIGMGRCLEVIFIGKLSNGLYEYFY